MGRKIRHSYLVGSTLRPLLRYVTGWEFVVNPLDRQGARLAQHWLAKAINQNPKVSELKEPIKLTHDDSIKSSYIVVKFVNGWTHGMFTRHANDFELERQIANISEIIECRVVTRRKGFAGLRRRPRGRDPQVLTLYGIAYLGGRI